MQTSCTTVNLATAPSPLAGTTWQAVFTQSDGAHDDCSQSTWDSNCVSRANAICTGGQEVFSRTGLRTRGFCGQPLIVNGG